ncbi:CAP domain-containing protein [Geitlerinema sp. P-1104]|uniref:CAP domain-containing protein n=1 Tax=Geitlerinema sp. P-1104 TaxID=2546230 RepID=UPI001476F06C|nr:CAP domain-containing protein [Geitlerinema sp. P-1104]NMG61087.1 CAP domain-containing protein [Geitlerinema sp. P-1104]
MKTGVLGVILLLTASVTGGCHLMDRSIGEVYREEQVLTATSQEDLRALEVAAHEQVNAYRQRQGLSPLELDERISAIARHHSQAMASGEVPFSHDGVEGRYEAIGDVIPYRQVAENVAYNFGYSDPVEQAVQGWIDSPGHEQNMSGDYDISGMGIAVNSEGEYYFTQLFVRPR